MKGAGLQRVQFHCPPACARFRLGGTCDKVTVLDSWGEYCHNSRMDSASLVVGSFLLLLAMVSVSVSINILLRGRIWRSLKPASRPRRWVLILLLVSLAVTVVWLPVFITWPHTAIAKGLSCVWVFVFAGTCLTMKWLAGIFDLLYERRGWPLR